jgi:hypothetical protein
MTDATISGVVLRLTGRWTVIVQPSGVHGGIASMSWTRVGGLTPNEPTSAYRARVLVRTNKRATVW